MGVFSMGPPADFILFIRDSFGPDTFVEGGTFRGGTARWAAPHFKKVITIELSPALRDAAQSRLRHLDNIVFLQGHTRDVLRRVVPSIDGPAVFWLDAHWSGGITSGEQDECPILDEIAIINQSPHNHVILIDDARLFTAPPPAPHKREQWPDIWSIEHALRQGRTPRRILITQDVIISVPEQFGERVAEYWHRWKPPKLPLLARIRQSWRALFT